MYQKIGVVGLGYVGVTLAAALADQGYQVHGVDTQPAVRETLRAGRPHIFEPGIDEVLARQVGRSLLVADSLPADLDAVVLCVSTPVDPASHRARLENLAAAAEAVAAGCRPGTLVVVRSTVPVGTSRGVVLPPLAAAWGDDVRLVMAPERTIQGQALRELVELPQVVGGLDEASLRAGLEFFGGLARQLVPVSSLEAAELVKLANNCHTDLIYSYGNELALIAEAHRLDPLEVIRAANLDYPRPDLSRPGYVGGGCLSKDPYLMVESAGERPPFLVGAARRLNEHLPAHVARRVVELLRQERGEARGARLAVLGWAYKGWPPTDDMRGTPVTTMLPILADAGLVVLGHDPMVTDEVIQRHGGVPTSLDKAFAEADAVLVLNDHPDYRALPVGAMLRGTGVRLVFDSWRILDEAEIRAAGVRYAGIGYLPADAGPPAPPARRDASSATVPA
ncbi:nucleotide sugar dehydrogenase [Micromonospora sp. NPDC048830]|uniref:nucleotide sugar dehydrogenase n=1 Tax=Micromonospora sp. NPDC048830 TaxID=3364257 RepID=UPI0037237D11